MLFECQTTLTHKNSNNQSGKFFKKCTRQLQCVLVPSGFVTHRRFTNQPEDWWHFALVLVIIFQRWSTSTCNICNLTKSRNRYADCNKVKIPAAIFGLCQKMSPKWGFYFILFSFVSSGDYTPGYFNLDEDP